MESNIPIKKKRKRSQHKKTWRMHQQRCATMALVFLSKQKQAEVQETEVRFFEIMQQNLRSLFYF